MEIWFEEILHENYTMGFLNPPFIELFSHFLIRLFSFFVQLILCFRPLCNANILLNSSFKIKFLKLQFIQNYREKLMIIAVIIREIRCLVYLPKHIICLYLYKSPPASRLFYNLLFPISVVHPAGLNVISPIWLFLVMMGFAWDVLCNLKTHPDK